MGTGSKTGEGRGENRGVILVVVVVLVKVARTMFSSGERIADVVPGP